MEILISGHHSRHTRADKQRFRHSSNEGVLLEAPCPANQKRQRAAALQDASRFRPLSTARERLGVRLPSAAFDLPDLMGVLTVRPRQFSILDLEFNSPGGLTPLTRLESGPTFSASCMRIKSYRTGIALFLVSFAGLTANSMPR